MNNYYDLEINVLSCLIQKPTLMKILILEDKHFIKHQKLWQFMKAFYNKFETFDLILMFNVCKNKYEIIQYIEWLTKVEPAISNFDKYQKQLIELYNQKQDERDKIKRIYELANDLYVGRLEIDIFKNKINDIIQ